MAKNYAAPLADMRFLLQTQTTRDIDDAMPLLDQAASFIEQEWATVKTLGDIRGCTFDQGQVTLPAEIKAAWIRYVDAGWMGITLPEPWGGQGLSATIGTFVGEMLSSANPALSMIPALTMSACKAIIAFGSESLKQTYLPKMVAGEWTGTMCMTEAHCGSDLGLIRTTATPLDEHRFTITGTKIFISAGEHDGSANIIHLVLARIKGAPEGVKGLSLFLVPKWLPDSGHATESGVANTVSCIGIEQKMGIHANPTCTMSFDAAQGFLVGRANEGIKAMFTMMNEMRLGTATQGVGLSECAFQESHAYATERMQGKALDPARRSANQADALISHADVRRMLLTQKAFAEGGRALCLHCATLLDRAQAGGDEGQAAEKVLGLLTPIAKAFLTETGLESASYAIQVRGGHGYIRDSGVEQIYRDGRISTLYEGTTGIQALDLLGRKVLGDQAQTLLTFTKQIHQLCASIAQPDPPIDHSSHPASGVVKSLAQALHPYAREWPQLAQQVGMRALQDHDEVGAAAYDFLMYSGYVCLAYFWLRMADAARADGLEVDPRFLSAKQKTATFYFDRLLPRAQFHKVAVQAGKAALSSFEDDQWSF
ncbi:MAG: acyl-CoA dehydrogenase [Burkholderiales bacterium]|nr:MAG: acyl-CoA dehydrogenase [Burkholderiales bacterium]